MKSQEACYQGFWNVYKMFNFVQMRPTSYNKLDYGMLFWLLLLNKSLQKINKWMMFVHSVQHYIHTKTVWTQNTVYYFCIYKYFIYTSHKIFLEYLSSKLYIFSICVKIKFTLKVILKVSLTTNIPKPNGCTFHVHEHTCIFIKTNTDYQPFGLI